MDVVHSLSPRPPSPHRRLLLSTGVLFPDSSWILKSMDVQIRTLSEACGLCRPQNTTWSCLKLDFQFSAKAVLW